MANLNTRIRNKDARDGITSKTESVYAHEC
jgi:hypothetical protein